MKNIIIKQFDELRYKTPKLEHFTIFKCLRCKEEKTVRTKIFLLEKPCKSCLKNLRGLKNFKEKVKNKYGNSLIIDFTTYKDSRTKVKVTCVKHNKVYYMNPSRLVMKDYKHYGAYCINGCPTCVIDRNNTKNEKPIKHYIDALKRRWPNFSIISAPISPFTIKSKINIDCDKHGAFTTTLRMLTSKYTIELCPTCKTEHHAWNSRMARTDIKGFVYFFYIPKIKKYKLGVTYRDIKRRMYEIGHKVELKWLLEFTTLADAYTFEYLFFREQTNKRYYGPKLLNKGGNTELFNSSIKKPSVRFIKEILCRKESNSGKPLSNNFEGNPERSLTK